MPAIDIRDYYQPSEFGPEHQAALSAQREAELMACLSHAHTAISDKIQAVLDERARACDQNPEDADYLRATEFMTAVNANSEQRFDCAEDEALLALQEALKNLYDAYSDDVKACQENVSEAVVSPKVQYHLFNQLLETVSSLQERLPIQEKGFMAVHTICEQLRVILRVDLPDTKDTKEKLTSLLATMQKTDLYKSWPECKGISEMASHIMYTLESAVRWFLECVGICSKPSDEARFQRKPFFFEGPKKDVFGKFSQALSDLNELSQSLSNAPSMG